MNDDRTYESIFIARQPVFDAHNETWGYMMLFRDSQDATGPFSVTTRKRP